eukprot:gene589-8097_t
MGEKEKQKPNYLKDSLALFYGFLVCTFIALFSSSENFSFKILPLTDHLHISIFGSLSVIFGSLSLIHNSVGFFQISKILVVPFQIGIEYFIYTKIIELKTLFSVILLLFGVSIVAISDVSVNSIGLIYAFLCTFTTALTLIYKSNYMEKMNVSPFHLLLNTSFISTFISLIPSPLFDEFKNIEISTNLIFTIFLSCFISLNVNFSILIVLKRTSALTHLVVSQLKTLFLIIMSEVIFEASLNIGYLFGVGLSVIGSTWYAQIRHEINLREKEEDEEDISNEVF